MHAHSHPAAPTAVTWRKLHVIALRARVTSWEPCAVLGVLNTADGHYPLNKANLPLYTRVKHYMGRESMTSTRPLFQAMLWILRRNNNWAHRKTFDLWRTYWSRPVHVSVVCLPLLSCVFVARSPGAALWHMDRIQCQALFHHVILIRHGNRWRNSIWPPPVFAILRACMALDIMWPLFVFNFASIALR